MVFPSETWRVSFQNEIKFDTLVHLVCFTGEICYDARPCERQTNRSYLL